MTTKRKTESNRLNAEHSTGPRTAPGKARAALNALSHGIRSLAPVLPSERLEDWEAHQSGIAKALAPTDTLQTALAGRVALCLWRLQRVTAYEMTVTMIRMEEAKEGAGTSPTVSAFPGSDYNSHASQLDKVRKALESKQKTVDVWEGTLELLRDLPGMGDEARLDGGSVYGMLEDIGGELPNTDEEYLNLEDKKFLAQLGVPADELHDPWGWEGWTAGIVRNALRFVASEFKTDPEKLWGKALEGREDIQQKGRDEVRRLKRELHRLQGQVQIREARQIQRCILPDKSTLEKIQRYESHVSRQLQQALHTLERIQKMKAGEPVPAPAVLDVTVSGEGMPFSQLENEGTD